MRDIRVVPGMTTSRLARRLGLDGNPLRRRTDKIAALLAVLLVAMFFVGVSVASIAAVGWAGRAAAAQQQAAHSWRQVPAVVQKAAPAPPSWILSGYSWVPARWTAPDGMARAGQVPVNVAVAAGQAVRVWVDATGTLTGPPPRQGAVLADGAGAAAVAVITMGSVLLCLMGAGRQVLGRGRKRHGLRSVPSGPDAFGRGASFPGRDTATRRPRRNRRHRDRDDPRRLPDIRLTKPQG